MTVDNYTNILRTALSEKKGTFINSSGMKKKKNCEWDSSIPSGVFLSEKEK